MARVIREDAGSDPPPPAWPTPTLGGVLWCRFCQQWMREVTLPTGRGYACRPTCPRGLVDADTVEHAAKQAVYQRVPHAAARVGDLPPVPVTALVSRVSLGTDVNDLRLLWRSLPVP